MFRTPANSDARDQPMLAACGLDCETCDLKPEKCGGCHSIGGKLWSADCIIRHCCLFDKNLPDCSACDGFPCQHILAFENDKWPHHRAAVQTLRRRREEKPSGPP